MNGHENGHGAAGRRLKIRLAAAASAATLAALGLLGTGAQAAGPAADGSVGGPRERLATSASAGEAKAARSPRNKTYGVSGDQLTGGAIKPKHRAIWERFIALVPTDERTQLGKFTVVRGNSGAFVAPLRDPTRWKLGVSAGLRPGELDYILVHEFGHLLTLESDQVPPGGSRRNCTTYFTGEGCSLPDSYVAQYVSEFWQSNGLLAKWKQARRRSNRGLGGFYRQNRDAFVSSYAVTNPAEDIAESFAAFAVAPSPSGSTIAEEKRRFFERFPELVELRDEIQAADPNPRILN